VRRSSVHKLVCVCFHSCVRSFGCCCCVCASCGYRRRSTVGNEEPQSCTTDTGRWPSSCSSTRVRVTGPGARMDEQHSRSRARAYTRRLLQHVLRVQAKAAEEGQEIRKEVVAEQQKSCTSTPAHKAVKELRMLTVDSLSNSICMLVVCGRALPMHTPLHTPCIHKHKCIH
jgi:hypothetical protein